VNNGILLMVKNRLRTNLNQLNHKISEEDALRLARFLLEDLDAARWRVVPAVPTREMVNASMTAMRKKRRSEGRVGEKRKHAWRLAAGIEAAPHWEVAEYPSVGSLGTNGEGNLETTGAVAGQSPSARLITRTNPVPEQPAALDSIRRLRHPIDDGWRLDRDEAIERR
jgi:hypothetical protein